MDVLDRVGQVRPTGIVSVLLQDCFRQVESAITIPVQRFDAKSIGLEEFLHQIIEQYDFFIISVHLLVTVLKPCRWLLCGRFSNDSIPQDDEVIVAPVL